MDDEIDEKFDMGMYVYCIKSDAYVKEGDCLYINACGDMSYAPTRPKKVGYGFGLQSQLDNSVYYYYTLDEMYDMFVDGEEYRNYYSKIHKRERALKEILNEESI